MNPFVNTLWALGPVIVGWLLLKQWYEEAPSSRLWQQLHRSASERSGSFWDPGED